MNIKNLIPWNWLKKEQEQEAESLPEVRRDHPAEPDYPLGNIYREIDRAFTDVFGSFGLPSPARRRFGMPMTEAEWLKPTLDVSATDREYNISVELPGVDQHEVQVELSGDTLVIKGEKKRETEEKGKNFHRVERSYGSFRRTLSLPGDAEREGIGAAFKSGVMTVTVPRKTKPEAETKRIEVKAA